MVTIKSLQLLWFTIQQFDDVTTLDLVENKQYHNTEKNDNFKMSLSMA